MYWLEMACRAQVKALCCNRDLVIPSQDVFERTAHLYQPTTRRPFNVMEWPAILRFLERRDPSFRT